MLLCGLAGCALAPVPTPPGMEMWRCETGTLRTQGAEPFVRLTLVREGEPAIVLSGRESERLALFTGGLVTVCGVPGRNGADILQPESFELRQMDGMQAYLGVLRRDGGPSLDPGSGRPEVPLLDVPGMLLEAGGREVWVAGEWMSDGFMVRAFGIRTG